MLTAHSNFHCGLYQVNTPEAYLCIRQGLGAFQFPFSSFHLFSSCATGPFADLPRFLSRVSGRTANPVLRSCRPVTEPVNLPGTAVACKVRPGIEVNPVPEKFSKTGCWRRKGGG